MNEEYDARKERLLAEQEQEDQLQRQASQLYAASRQQDLDEAVQSLQGGRQVSSMEGLFTMDFLCRLALIRVSFRSR